MESEDKLATQQEVAEIIYNTDIYKKIKSLTDTGNYEANNLIWTITTNINTHYSYFLKGFDSPSEEREKYLISRIESELSWYLSAW